ncbi:hypothetical protein PJK54_11825 [Cobetia sp. MMG027]|uniref:hypothetical protein n=1 Tax=Cobetia sp. MMG027 TaxID=3021980 RepID=UPI0022FEE79D|nr:hypothetical protein [Cobetia sp. MMG027]MDA5564352.1 hypothetical protein [Cobetia sp. MMG027]
MINLILDILTGRSLLAFALRLIALAGLIAACLTVAHPLTLLVIALASAGNAYLFANITRVILTFSRKRADEKARQKAEEERRFEQARDITPRENAVQRRALAQF